MEHVVLQPILVTKVFIHTLLKGGKSKHSKGHTLQPLALSILNDIVYTVFEEEEREDDTKKGIKKGTKKIDEKNEKEVSLSVERRMVIIRLLLWSNPSFDSITQTDTISSLLDVPQDIWKGGKVADADAAAGSANEEASKALCEAYMDFLKTRILVKQWQ